MLRRVKKGCGVNEGMQDLPQVARPLAKMNLFLSTQARKQNVNCDVVYSQKEVGNDFR